MGDLGNLEEDDFGTARVSMTDHKVSLVGPQTIIGRSIVVSDRDRDIVSTSQPVDAATWALDDTPVSFK